MTAPSHAKPSLAYVMRKRDEHSEGLLSKPPSDLNYMCAHLCCQEIRPRDEVVLSMLGDNADAQPSLFQRICICQTTPQARIPSGIEDIPEIAGLAGIVIQDGDHSTSGSLQTLKWAKFDLERRVVYIQVWGGFGDRASTGVWTIKHDSPFWIYAMNEGRLMNYSYSMHFDEDWKRATIRIHANLTGGLWLCCPGVPCVPACLTLPSYCASFTMTQVGELDGTEWHRESIFFGCIKREYVLREVLRSDGSPGKFHDCLNKAPAYSTISR